MAGVLFLASLAGMASAIATPSLKSTRQADADTTSSSNVTLTPVTASSTDGSAAISPNVNVSLPYASDQTVNSIINVDLTTSSASVLLEAISSVVSVECSSDSVTVTFDSAEDLASAYSEWSGHPLLVLVTNHMGDCDSEVERGFFTADSYTTDASTLTLVAAAQKASLSDIGCSYLPHSSGHQAKRKINMFPNIAYLRTNFSGIPVVSSSKRGLGSVTYSPDPINFSTDLVLNETVLFETDDFSATVDSGSLDISVTVGGFITYNIITSTLGTLCRIPVSCRSLSHRETLFLFW